MKSPKMGTAETFHRALLVRHPNIAPAEVLVHLQNQARAGLEARRQPTEPRIEPTPGPNGLSDVELPAYLNDGQWKVRCPWCGSCQLAAESDPRFFCVECLNAEIGGKAARVAWPDPLERAAIEGELSKRQNRRQHKWTPGTTLEDIRERNKQMKVR